MIDNKELNVKVCMNSLITERLIKLSTEERQKVVLHILEVCDKSERQLAKDLGIPHTTLNGWKTGKIKDKTFQYMKLDNIITKLRAFKPKDDEEIYKLECIKEIIEDILRGNE